ncbi:MAG: ethylbenzene dehydrogenase-related protein [Planctomycetota bacterium]
MRARLRAPVALLLFAGLLLLPACKDGGGRRFVVVFQAGDTLPGYVQVIPRGSRADVVAKGRYDPATNEWTVEICRLLDTGHADDALFSVGTDKVFSIGVTDNAASVHNGDQLVNLIWTGTPDPDNVVVVDLGGLALAAPVIDGDASDPAWDPATTGVAESSVGFTAQAPPDNLIGGATVQAAWLDEFIYFRVTWTDPTQTENIHRRQWTFDGANWSQNTENEDRLYFMWDVTGAQGTSVPGTMTGTTTPFSTNGCAIACHGDGFLRMDRHRADIWHWKSTRTDPAGYLDDKFIWAAPPATNGRQADEGLGAYIDNVNQGGTGPAFRSTQGGSANPDFLFLMPDDHDFAVARPDDTGFVAGDRLPGYVQRAPRNSRADVSTRGEYDAATGKWKVEFARALDTGSSWTWGSPVRFREDALWSAGDQIPGYVTVPPIGSFGDVQARGQYDGASNTWTVEVSRFLTTSHPDDIQFDPADDTIIPIFSVGVTDNSGGTHDGEPAVTLLWTGTAQSSPSPPWVVAEDVAILGTPPPSVDGAGGDAAWGAAQTTTVALSAMAPIFGGPPQSINSVDVQAVRTATRIYFKFLWTDTTQNEFRNQWEFDGTSWFQKTTGLNSNEDRLYVMWDIGQGALGTATPGADDGIGTTPFTGGNPLPPISPGGCTVLCHGDGLMRTDSGMVDTWHWKATRNNGSGWLDDKNADPAGRHADDGAGGAAANVNAAGTRPNYQHFSDPGAFALRLHFTGRPAPDDTALVVGYRVPFALGLTDSSGGTHDGAPLLGLDLSGAGTPSATEIVALDLAGTNASAPTVDGDDNDPAWSLASPSAVGVTPMSGGGFGITSAEMRAVHDRDHIYVLVSWTDPSATETILKKRREFDGTVWSTTGAPDEDRVYLLWLMTEALGTSTPGVDDGAEKTPFRLAGCTMACHSGPVTSIMRTQSGLLDMWHWKAARTNGLGFSDDKYFGPAASMASGRFGDFGRSSHTDNGTATAPAFRAASGPGANLPYLMEPLLSGAHHALSLQPTINIAPFANAGPDRTWFDGMTVTLDGTGSFDPNGTAITYSWVQVPTGGTTVTLSGANTASPTFTAPSVNETLTFQLTVSDGTLQHTDTVDITIQVVVPVISYAADVHPLWSTLTNPTTGLVCTACHSGASPSAGMDLGGTAAATRDIIVNGGRVDTTPGNEPNSLILAKPLDPALPTGVNHTGGIFFTTTSDADYQTILNWILQGAPNN